MAAPRLILASASPRREQLLREAGFRFDVIPSDAPEPMEPHFTPREVVLFLARSKAVAVAALHPGATVIGADTLVVLEGEPLGKPRDLAAATGMLRRLAGREHAVFTGVWVRAVDDGISRGFAECTRVLFRRLDESAIREYLARIDPLDKAGAYAIQDGGDSIIESISGARDNVMGLPVRPLAALLREVFAAREKISDRR